MILTCPSCKAQYLVQKGQIPPEGRKVKCKNCHYTWLQAPKEEVIPEVVEENSLVEEAPVKEEEETRISLEEAESRAEQQESGDGPEGEEQVDSNDSEDAELAVDRDETAEQGQEEENNIEVNKENKRSFEDDVSEVYSNSISAEIYDDVPQVSIIPFITGVAASMILLIAGALIIGHLTNSNSKAIQQLSSVILGQKPVILSPLNFSDLSAEFSAGTIVVRGRLDNISEHEEEVPPYVVEALERGKVIGMYEFDHGVSSIPSGGSAVVTKAIDDFPARADAIKITKE